jgi:NodT family efflux transporter outer membrane factor (OMF) lipoprotein
MKTNAMFLVLAMLAATASGCLAVGPDYQRPKVELPLVMPEADTSKVDSTIRITSTAPVNSWWTVFNDPQLEQLIADAHRGNFDIRAAVARVHAQRALVRQSFAPLLPTISATGQYNYAQVSKNAVIFSPPSGSAPGTGTGTSVTGALNGDPYQLWSGTGDLSYELDLWGRIRRGLEASEADEAATEEDKKNIEITQFAEVANAYFDLGQAEAELAITLDGVATRERTLVLVRGRFDSGLAPELELRRAESELARARAEVPQFERSRALAQHRLAILTGRMPDVKFAGRPPAEFELPPEVPVGLPATLLERRPDIRAAELRVHANNAHIGEAIARFFPTVTITGRAGYASLNAGTLAQPASQLWSIGPSINIPIFQGGQTYAQMLQAEALTDEATAQFYKAVLTAFGEVADAIASLAAHEKVRDRQRENVVASERSVEVATIEYDQGLTPYLQVLDAQRELLTARQLLVRAQRDVLSDLVQLQKALGGGWTETPADEWTPTKSGT